MLVFVTAAAGGTGRTVTAANVAYRAAVEGHDVCYLDFNFGRPNAGAIFHVSGVARGVADGGMHSYFRGDTGDPVRVDVWRASDREALRQRPRRGGDLVLFPGNSLGGEFSTTPAIVERCVRILSRVEEEFDLCLVDLSAGRSYAADLVLKATQHRTLRATSSRWLVFHRWTRQHLIDANGLVHGAGGIVDTGAALGHDPDPLRRSIRFVRTAYVDPSSASLDGLRPGQVVWLRETDEELLTLASRYRIGRASTIGIVPFDPVLQWREQLVLDGDVWHSSVVNQATSESYDLIARRLFDEVAWEDL